MNDLLQFQIKQSCKLASPNGLQELMSDISREVLRSQPEDLCNFITEYLKALLEARDKLAVAAQICDEVCHGSCQPELEDELRNLGMSDADIKLVGNIVQKYFEEGQGEKVHETLLYELSKKINVDMSVLEAVVDAVIIAFRRHFVNNAVKYEISEDYEDDRATKAAKNTVKFYKNKMSDSSDSETEESRESNREKKGVGCTNKEGDETHMLNYLGLTSVSSMSLAGSHINLPKHQPYDANESCRNVTTLEEYPEKEEMNLTYPEDTIQLKSESQEAVSTNEDGEKNEEREREINEESIALSIFLAGSLVNVSKHDDDATNLSSVAVDQTPEKEQMNLDYTVETDSKKISEEKTRQE